MDGFRDHAYDALRKAAAPALERIRKDRKIEGLPGQVGKLLGYLERHVFEPGLNVTTWRRKARVRDNAVSTDFRAWLGETPLKYLHARRLETAARMLAATDLEERQIGRAIGFTSYRAFRDGYSSWAGKLPSEDRDRLPPRGVDLPTLQRAFRGELTRGEAEVLIDTLRRAYPDADADCEEHEDDPAPVARTVVDGADYERFHADQLWQRIRALPFEDQKWQVRGYLFHSTVLFDLLRKKSREEGRKDRELGVRIAELALVSLEGHEVVFGERIYDLRSLGWAWLANARRLVLDSAGAEAELARADREWSVVRAEKDLTVLAEIQLIKSGLRTWQCRYEEALDLLGESIRLSRLTGALAVQAQALIQRASVKGFMGRSDEAIVDVRSALNINHGDPYLDFTGTCNLAYGLARLGRADDAAELISSAKKLSVCSMQPLARHQVQWIEAVVKHGLGDREKAEMLYSQAQGGFATLGDMPALALVSLDLSIFHAEEHRRLRASTLARKTVVILQALKLDREALAAVDLLAKEIESQKLTEVLLRETQQRLHQCPLIQLQ